MSSDDIKICEFLLLDPKATIFTKHFDSMCYITLIALANLAINTLVDIKKQNNRALKIAAKKEELLPHIIKEDLNGLANASLYYSQIEEKINLGLSVSWINSNLNHSVMKDQFLLYALKNEEFLLWMINTNKFQFFLTKAIPIDNIDVLNTLLQTLCSINSKKIEMNPTLYYVTQ